MLWQKTATVSRHELPLPVLVILHILCGIHVEHDEAVQVTARERLHAHVHRGLPAPLPRTQHTEVSDLGCGFQVLDHALQGDVLSLPGEKCMKINSSFHPMPWLLTSL